MLINLRNALMAGKRLPYDAEVEYLQSTGTQWIDTGVLYSGPCTIRVTAQLTPSDAERDLFGAYDRPSVVGNMVCGIYNHFVFLYNQGITRIDSYHLGSNPVMLTIECDFTDNLCTLIVNGQSYSGNTVYYNEKNITIFRGNTTLSADGIFKCYRFSIIRAGVLVRDFIPVRKGTVGYLYDRVSGKLFGNAGTGDFVLGPDVVPVEYIESTGTEWQWINALDSARDANSFEMSVAMLTDNSARRIFFGSGSGSSQYLEVTAATSWGLNSASLAVCQIGAATTISADTNRVLQINGATVGYGLNLIGSTAPSSPLCLFKTSGYNNLRCAVRCFYFKAWQSSVLARSFRPVRVGTGSTWEGAMMDVLTRRVYRNAGTGAFTYGNDLKYPIPAE